MKTILIATLMLTGCANVMTTNVMPTLTPEQVAQKVAACPRNTTARPYPPDKPQIVMCQPKTVLPPGYVSPVPYVRIL